MSKPNIFHLLTIGFPWRVGLTGKLCCSWTSGCTDCCHWATRTPWSCSCYLSWCHDQTILWTGFKELLHAYVYDSQRLRAAETKNQGPTKGVNHSKNDLIINVVLQPGAVLVAVADAITGTRTASWAWGWSFCCSCQHKGKLCQSLEEGPKHRWLREMWVVWWWKSSSPGCHWKSLWGIDHHPQNSFGQWSSQGRCWGSSRCWCSHSCTPIQEVKLVGQTFNTFLVWSTHLVKWFLEQVFHFIVFKNY